MTTHVFHAMKTIVKRLAVVAVLMVMLFSVSQTAALADSSGTETVGIPGVTKSISSENDTDTKEQRREWQNKASNLDAKQNEPETLGEKLNVEEITEGFDPEREGEKRSKPIP